MSRRDEGAASRGSRRAQRTQGTQGAQPTEGAAEESFEVLYARLEEVTARLDAGDLALEQALALYEQGMALARRCQELLGGAEQRIETLRQEYERSEQAE